MQWYEVLVGMPFRTVTIGNQVPVIPEQIHSRMLMGSRVIIVWIKGQVCLLVSLFICIFDIFLLSSFPLPLFSFTLSTPLLFPPLHRIGKLRDSGDYGIVRKGSDPGSNVPTTKGRTNSTDQGYIKHHESSSSSSLSVSSSTRSRGDSIDNNSVKESRRPSEPNTKLVDTKKSSER